MKKKISIITPCLNSLALLKDTVSSIINQKSLKKNQFDLEYIICDGGSVDGTVEWIESIKRNFKFIKLVSEPDLGMYDALAKGFSRVSGNIVGYINCGDYYSPYTFMILNDIFGSVSSQSWITGYRCWYNDKGYLVGADLPFKYRQRLIQKGVYGRFLPYIQQESTFWRSELLSCLDLNRLSGFRLAGDYYLWVEFSKVTKLNIVKAYLGGFRSHKGQLSSKHDLYNKELKEIASHRLSVLDYVLIIFDRLAWLMNDEMKIRLNKDIIKL